MFLHFPSFSFIFFHVPSCSFMFLHVPSCSFMFFHVPSCSFIFFFVFLGCSKSEFFWDLNFVTISLDNSHVKNQFLGPSRRYPPPTLPLGNLFFFFLLFFFRFCLSLFVAFYFFIFSHFCSFLHFFNVFHFLFSFWPTKKFLLFFFLVFLSNIFLLLALVSEFNCFLRWCPDDIGRDSWDWVGPPAWRRACFNSPEWGGGSSPVKTEPHQIVLLLLLLLNGYIILKE